MNKEHASKDNPKKLVILIGIPLLLILSLALVFGSTRRKGTITEQYPVEEEVIDEEEFQQEEITEESSEQFPVEDEVVEEEAVDVEQYPAEPMQDGRATGVISDLNDMGWKEYKPLNLKVEKDTAARKVNLSWDFPDTAVKPETVLIGYWYTDFDRIEKFVMHPQLSQDQKIVWAGFVPDFSQEGLSGYSAELDLNKLPGNRNTVYFYIYMRVSYPTGEHADYIYGANDTENQPFIVTF